MDLQMGSHVFRDVAVPLLWGTRAIIQDAKQRLSVIDLGGHKARLEVLGDKPAPGVEFRPLSGGAFEVLEDRKPLYAYDAAHKAVRGISLRLPECRVQQNSISIGTNVFTHNRVHGFGVGIMITADGGIAVGAPLPPGLAKLQI
jgi:hypothetical protein